MTGVLETGLAVAKVIKEAYGYYKMIKDLTAPADPATISELYSKLMSVDRDVDMIKDEVRNLSWEVRRTAVQGLERDIGDRRVQYASALRRYREDPEWEKQAYLAAAVLAEPLYWHLPGRVEGAQVKFDPTLVLADFLAAVSTWLLLRRDLGIPWTPDSRADLARFADRLEWAVAQIEVNVTGTSRQGTGYRPVGGPVELPRPWHLDPIPTVEGPEPIPQPVIEYEAFCYTSFTVYDEIAEVGTTTDGDEGPGECPPSTGSFAPTQYLEQRYSLTALRATVADWRGTA